MNESAPNQGDQNIVHQSAEAPVLATGGGFGKLRTTFQ